MKKDFWRPDWTAIFRARLATWRFEQVRMGGEVFSAWRRMEMRRRLLAGLEFDGAE